MHELRAKLDRDRRAIVANGVDSPTDAAPSLEDDRGRACFRESLRGSETGDSGSDNDDVYALMHGAS
jgi:hypothetical protein